MGYSYEGNKLCCDKCGSAGGVRKRLCTHKVTDEQGHVLPYCYPPALCGSCLKSEGGSKKLHASCAAGAASSQAEYDKSRSRLEAGEFEVAAAFGSWHELVPENYCGVIFRDQYGQEEYRLLLDKDVDDTEGYDPAIRGWLSDYTVLTPWDGPYVSTKQVNLVGDLSEEANAYFS